MRAALLAAMVWATGCAKSDSLRCGDLTCPAGTHCSTSPTTPCVPDTCGNDEVDLNETCEVDLPIDRDTVRCTDFGFYKQQGELTCTDACTIDMSACSEFCGDHVINGTERCDGLPPTGFACSDFGFDVGPIGCANGCTPSFDYCSNLGWQLVPGGGSDELYAVHLASQNSGVAVGRAGQIIAAEDGVWLPITQSLTTEDLNGIFANTDGIIAVGNGGTILRYDGTTVSKMTSPTGANLRAISGGPTGSLAVGDGGTIIRFDGTSWTTMVSPTTENLYGVFVVGPLRAYAVGANGTVLRFNGTMWADLGVDDDLPSAMTLYAVHVIDDVVFLAGTTSTIARLDSQEQNATVLPRPFDMSLDVTLRAIWAASKNEVYVGGSNGQLIHWNGSYLTLQDTSTNRTITGLDGVVGRVVGVTRGGSVIAFNGTSRHVSSPTAGALLAVYTDGTRTVAAGNSIAVHQSDGNWVTQENLPETARSVVAAGNFIFAGTSSRDLGTPGLYRYQIDALTASPVRVSAAEVRGVGVIQSPFRIIAVGADVIESTSITADTFSPTSATSVHGTNMLNGVWPAPDGVWFAVGDNGTAIRRGTNGMWTALTTGTTRNLVAVSGTASDDVWAVGDLGTILHWDGTSWRAMYSGTAEDLVAITAATPSDVTLTGTGFTRMHYDGISWSRMASYGLDTPSLATYRGTTWYVSGARIERSDRAIAMNETKCGDAFDNDLAHGTNCEDPDCYSETQCVRGGACETLERVTCETGDLPATTFTGVARLTDLPCLDHSTPGPEASFRFVADRTGTFTVTIDNPVLDLVVTQALAGHCQLETCEAATSGSVTVPVVAGQIYYIVVDGPVGVGASFTLSVTCS